MQAYEIFNIALKRYETTKKTYAHFAKIPYDTVTGWERAKYVPPYAFELLKKMIFDRKLALQNTHNYKRTRTEKEAGLRQVGVAFWGKNIDPENALTRAKRGNIKYLATILTNVYYKDALVLLGPQFILKHIEKCEGYLPKTKIDFLKAVCEESFQEKTI